MMRVLWLFLLGGCGVKGAGLEAGFGAVASAGPPAVALFGLDGEACAAVIVTSAVAGVAAEVAAATEDRPERTPDVVIDLGECGLEAPEPMPCDARIAWDVTSSYLAQVPDAWDGLAGGTLTITGMPWPVCEVAGE